MNNSHTAIRNTVAATLLLALFAMIGTGLVAFTFEQTQPRIRQNEREALLRNLHEIISPDSHDNELFKDTIQVHSPQLLGTRDPVTVYRARKDSEPIAAALTPVAPDGYNGVIKLLVGIRYDGTITGVRVITHHETPGLGDAIEADRSEWIHGFQGKSLGNPPLDQWRVERDGGAFDQFTGATITPRAVVKAVRKALVYFRDHRAELFERESQTQAAAQPPAAESNTTFPAAEQGRHQRSAP